MKTYVLLGLFLASSLTVGVSHASFVLGTPTETLMGPNVRLYLCGASISGDGLELFCSGISGTTQGRDDLYVLTRPSKGGKWSLPENLGPTVNSSADDLWPEITADGLALYFMSDRPGGLGGRDIWVTTRESVDDPWGEPENLGSPVNGPSAEDHPSISVDQLTLYFMSMRTGGSGVDDLWVTTRPTCNDAWGQPVNLGPTVNSSAHEYGPCISADQCTLLFTSTRAGGYGGGYGDIWITRRATTDGLWGEPMNLGSTVNGPTGELMPEISPDGSTLYFTSDDRGGGWGIWESSITLVVDFNGDGEIDFGDFYTLAQSWLAENALADIAPGPLGDVFVGMQDLVVFAAYWHKDLSLLAHWMLDEIQGHIAHDSAGKHDATVITEDESNPSWQPAGGKIQGALQFDGINDYVKAPFVLNPAEGPFSAFAWIKDGRPGEAILSQREPGDWSGSIWLGAAKSDGRLFTNLCLFELVTDKPIADGQWHHLGIVWDGSRRHLYVDGVEVAVDPSDRMVLSAIECLHIGAGKGLEAGSFWSGLIDDVRIYKRVVSADEVAALTQ